MSRIFDRHGNYVAPDDPIGRQLDSLVGKTSSVHVGERFDGTRSPLDAVPPSDHCLDESGPFHVGAPGMWNAAIQRDYDAMLRGAAPEHSWAVEYLRSRRVDPSSLRRMTEGRRRKLINGMVRAANREMRQRTPEFLRENQMREAETAQRAERTELHEALREWAAGPLTLEHPQGSSFHHMREYDEAAARASGTSSWAETITPRWGEPTIFVVERDWARAFAGHDLSAGEIRMPFPFCCFEFRISGVRVLALVYEEDDVIMLVYGRGGVWVGDDYHYALSTGAETPLRRGGELVSFGRVARLARDNIRVACIMVDANVAIVERRAAPAALVQRRRREGRVPPRDHAVIDLKRARHHYESSGRGAGAGTSTRSPQRGHFRRGTWVHYDDVESGRVPYADDGGFWHSRTWRSWHFAGDPKNIIEREYRL